MATIEHAAPPTHSTEQVRAVQPVFSADDGRRERVLQAVGRLAAVFVGVWLLALLVGAMGFGRLPGLPGSTLLDRAGRPAKARAEAPHPLPLPAVRGELRTSFAERSIAASVGPLAQRRTGSSPARTRPRTPRQPAAQPPPASQGAPPAVLPPSPGKPQGRAVRRHGTPAQPAPPPPGNGSSRGQAVVNPGRLKHEVTLPPPPPPPPPPKKP
jgi:hypothetical protein